MSSEDFLAAPCVFDTSAESWFARADHPDVQAWFIRYLELHPVYVSAVTVIERMTGYNLAMRQAFSDEARLRLGIRRAAYIGDPNRVLPVDAAVAAVAAELMALVPDPPSPPRRTHRAAESRSDRLARWRFDCLVAATALTNRLAVMHNNPQDFEALRTALEIDPGRLPGFGPLNLLRCTRVAPIEAVRAARAPVVSAVPACG